MNPAMGSFEQVVLGRKPAPPVPRATSGNVTRSDSTGVWVTAQGGDQNHPSGPCRGAVRPVLAQGGATTYEPLPIGTRVLYVSGDDGPWVIAWEAS
ncbi:hypothetical protein [Kineococcus sp. SYSU DK002]|uniref:hypothetical protein n=1 Tax=Kineococcus sp. SYSU DK002 TaxID=3383123 RepID=UPI003D7CB134